MKIFRFVIFVLGCVCIFSCVIAQPGSGDPSNGNPTPITGIEILIGLGGLFGVKKILDNRKKNKQP